MAICLIQKEINLIGKELIQLKHENYFYLAECNIDSEKQMEAFWRKDFPVTFSIITNEWISIQKIRLWFKNSFMVVAGIDYWLPAQKMIPL